MQRRLLAIWIVLLVGASAVTGFHIVRGLKLNSNVLSMLPGTRDAGWLSAAKSTINTRASRHVMLLLSHRDRAKLKAAAGSLRRDLVKSDFAAVIAVGASAETDADYWRCAPQFLLSAGDRALLRAGTGDQIARRAVAQIFSPFSPVDRNLLRLDPFLLVANYVSSLPFKAARLGDGVAPALWSNSGRYLTLLHLRLAQDPISNKSLEGFVPHLAALSKSLEAEIPGLEIKKTGAVFYAARAINQAQSEAGLIGSISIIAIIVMSLLVFRGLRPIALTLLAVGAGVLVGSGAVLLLFGKIHAIALIFGAGLIGVSVDYAFHYCVQRFVVNSAGGQGTPAEWLRRILKPLSLGMISTVVGFLTLALSPFPGLQQIAVFAAAGLAASYLTVLAIFPLLDRPGQRNIWPPLVRLGVAFLAIGSHANSLIGRVAVIMTLLALAIFGVSRFHSDDNIRRLQILPEDLKRQERDIRAASAVDAGLQFFLLRAGTREKNLMTEEALAPKLRAMIQTGDLQSYHMLSQFLPSAERRRENRELLQQQLYAPHLQGHLARLGRSNYRPEACAKVKIAPPRQVRQLILSGQNQDQVHMISLNGVKDLAAMRHLAGQIENLYFVDYAGDISTVLAQLRQRAFWPLGFACLGIWLLLGFFQGLGRATRTILVPVVAVLLTPLITSAFGGAFTLFNAMALVLVFVIGLDYAIFLNHAARSRFGVVVLANALAAFSTVMAFGMLAFSSNYAVHAFGVTVLTGIILAFTLSFLARDRNPGQIKMENTDE